jgi:eukaryotic-like serine/threonine-protein kinase
MKPERLQQLDRLFHSALERGPAERADFLDEACAGDESLRREVEALLLLT